MLKFCLFPTIYGNMSKGESKKFRLLAAIVGGASVFIVVMIGSQLEWKCLGEDFDTASQYNNFLKILNSNFLI